jgi:hypothetical protein
VQKWFSHQHKRKLQHVSKPSFKISWAYTETVSLLTEPTRKRFWPTDFFKIWISLSNRMRFSTISFYRPFDHTKLVSAKKR